MTGPSAGATDRLRATLDRLAESGRTAALWWRDDDLERPTPELAALLAELGGFGIVPGLAAVAGRLVPEAVDAAGDGRLLVHGWHHQNYSEPGTKRSEYGPERAPEVRLREIAGAWRRLRALAGERALPCFVPPWNRIGDDLPGRLGETGIRVLSGFASRRRRPVAAAVPRLDTHVDLIDWRGGRGPLPAAAVAAALDACLRAAETPDGRESPVDGPIGILSHHLVTDAAGWAGWRPLLAALAGHPAVRWLDPAAAMAAAGAAPGAGDETRRTG
jgi:hypothetical protein